MARVESSLVYKRMPWHANFTELNHLGAANIAKPHKFGDTMRRLFSNYMYSDNPLTSILSGTGREVTIGSNEWEWELRGASTRPLVYVGTAGSAIAPGVVAELPLDENFFLPGDILSPGNPKFQVRIQEACFKRGNAWVYRVTPMGSDTVPATFLKAGAKWSKLYAQYEEGSNQGGSTQYALPLALKSKLNRFRKTFSVTGDAANEVLAVSVPDAKGTRHTMWVKYAETTFWSQWYRELERGYWYTRTSNVQGSTGRPVTSGPGLDELLEDSHQHYYTTFTAKMLEEFLMDIFYSRVKPGSGRKMKVFTGEYGMILFHRAVTDAFQKNGFITVDSNFIQSDSSPYHSNGLSFGAQFTRYKMANGAEIELVHNPLFDDREIHYDIDPVTGYPYESMRFVFTDFLTSEGESNMLLVKKKGGYKLGYVAGLQTPYGPVQNSLMSHAGDYYSMELHDQCGVQIHDISRMGELRVLRA